ncbi:uncharacterized protein LOC130962780 [Arachis stenosperma]|uniref:uncharacterized protein LOC130962779 n=1 Tax=Arachis stenosperma TaxID=217475 RepID=UPI0025AC7EBE|nr:uncharacterized protein LOC130962779 [Arachis stenosperma]XP_057744930.1 uncharacterized protein LOC130962780 [Arachis stenosperma]
MERALQAQLVPEEQCVEFATYLLTGEASHWWQGARRLLQQGNYPITWDAFQVEFYKKYFPNSARTSKELGLLRLKQGVMSVSEYTDKFEELFRKAVEAKNDRRESHRREHNQEYPTRGQEFKRRGYPQRFPQRRNDLATSEESQRDGKGKRAAAASNVLSCQRCGSHHPNRPCLLGLGLVDFWIFGETD